MSKPNRIISILCIIIACVILIIAISPFTFRKVTVEEKREQYIKKTLEKLQEIKSPIKKSHQVEELNGRYLHSGGFIPVGNEGWVYCIGRSFHEDSDEEFGIGDVNLAIDHDGIVYVNYGHLCEGPSFWSDSKDGLLSMEEFFHPTPDSSWVKYQSLTSNR